jgi:surface polysaccharide O-acyltransferase-like enzyme
MYQAQRQGRVFVLALAVGLPFLLWVKPTGAMLALAIVGIYIAAPVVVHLIDLIEMRRREMRRVPRAVVSRRRRR